MALMCPGSLSQTVNQINHAFFFGEKIAPIERESAAEFAASRQGLPHAYAGTFALFDDERHEGIRLFTGERITSAAARHIIGQETCRAIRMLKPQSRCAREALSAATKSLQKCVGPAAPTDAMPDDGQQHRFWLYRGGTYCCGPCSVALWRNIVAQGYDEPEVRLERAMKCLRAHRKGSGQWRIFPYWYTLSALIDIENREAIDEMRYAAANCEKAAKRSSDEPFAMRRIEIAKRVLARI